MTKRATVDATPIKPQRLMRDLPQTFPAHTRYLWTTGNSSGMGDSLLYTHLIVRFSGKREAAVVCLVPQLILRQWAGLLATLWEPVWPWIILRWSVSPVMAVG